MTARREGWPRHVRLRRSSDFQRVQRNGKRWKGRHLIAIHSPSASDSPRVGLVVSRRVGNAVTRNRVKRWLREASRRRLGSLTGVDVVLIARSSAATAGAGALADDVGRALDMLRREYA